MKTSVLLAVGVIGIALGVFASLGLPSIAPAQDRPVAKDAVPAKGKTARPKWEYKVLAQPTGVDQAQEVLNTLGEEGWELAGTTNNTYSSPNGASIATRTTVQLIFKRAKP